MKPRTRASSWRLAQRSPARSRVGIAARLSIAVSILLVAISAVQTYELVTRDLKRLREYLGDYARTVAKSVSQSAEASFATGNLDPLRQLAQQTLELSDVVYCRFYDAAGKIIGSAATLRAEPLPLERYRAPSAVAGDTLYPEIWEFRSPIFVPAAAADQGSSLEEGHAGPPSHGWARGDKRYAGLVSVGISLATLEIYSRDTIATAAMLAFFATLFAVLGTFLVSRAVTTPLKSLVDAANAISGGDLATRVRIRRSDEAGALAGAFNEMARNLARSRAELEAEGELLAEKVVELEQANHLKSEFLATVSHELRTPLNVIIGYTEILRDEAEGRFPEEQLKMLDRIRRYSKLQLDLVTSVLDFSRLGSGKVSLHVESFELRPVLEEILILAAHRRISSEVELCLEVARDLPALTTDRVKLQEVIRNLVENAVKFTERGLIVVMAAQDRSGENVVITVSDSGRGIPEDELPSIFEPFRQVGASSTRSTGGVGLGLSIVRQLLDALGGSIGVNSRLGEGTSFKVVLPVRVADATYSVSSAAAA